MNLSILITCHNRHNVTRNCLSKLYQLRNDIDVYCVDDNSSDGTSEMIKKEFPQVTLIHGNGNLFWSRGMRLAWETALQSNKDYKYYFWLNDDLELYPNAFNELLECLNLVSQPAIISGLVQSAQNGEAMYGGHDKNGISIANGRMNPIQNMNGNFVLIPNEVVDKIGILDPVFHHDLGDVDYGLTALEASIPVLSSRCYIGNTDASLKSNNKRNRRAGVSLKKRFKILYSPLGSNPNITFHFMKKHHGYMQAIAYYCYVHIINIIPDKIYKLLSR